MEYTQEQIEAQAAALHPGAAPAWLAKFVAILMKVAAWLPSILVLFMAKKPGLLATASADLGDDDRAFALIEAAADAEMPPKMQGPILDPILKTLESSVWEFVEKEVPVGIAFAKSYADRLLAKLSPLTP